MLIERAAELYTGDTWRNLRLALDEIKAVRYQVQGTTIVQSTRLTAEAAAGAFPTACIANLKLGVHHHATATPPR